MIQIEFQVNMKFSNDNTITQIREEITGNISENIRISEMQVTLTDYYILVSVYAITGEIDILKNWIHSFDTIEVYIEGEKRQRPINVCAWFMSDIYVEIDDSDCEDDSYDEYGYSEEKEEAFWIYMKKTLPRGLKFSSYQLESEENGIVAVDMAIVGSRNKIESWLKSLEKIVNFEMNF